MNPAGLPEHLFGVRDSAGQDEVGEGVTKPGLEAIRSPAQLADRFRDGRAFLAGDAAHRVTPSGAFGLNTAIQTAHNLAWKLAAVIQGWAGPGLLDSFEAERRPWTARTVELSLRLNSQPRRAMARTGGHVLGIVYEAGALVPDGTAAPEV